MLCFSFFTGVRIPLCVTTSASPSEASSREVPVKSEEGTLSSIIFLRGGP